MKTCNCGCIYNDDYEGTCDDCGAGLGGGTKNPASLVWGAPRAAQEAARQERQINAHDHNNMRFDRDDPVFSAARDMVLDFRTPEQRARDERDGA